VHSIQIWINTAEEDLPPSYQQVAFSPSEKRGQFRLLAGPKATSEQPATTINQDARIYVSELGPGEELARNVAENRYAWVQVLRGNIELNGQNMSVGDGAAVTNERKLSFSTASSDGCEFLLFDLP
jgi:redox-sensitive bicupin YhaK (pirin superfamily)